MITSPDHYSYSVHRNCCPSRYSALSGWGQHKRCGFRRATERGGAGGGLSGGLTNAFGFEDHGINHINSFSSAGNVTGTRSSHNNGGIIIPPLVAPIPGPVLGAGLISWIILIGMYLIIGKVGRIWQTIPKLLRNWSARPAQTGCWTTQLNLNERVTIRTNKEMIIKCEY